MNRASVPISLDPEPEPGSTIHLDADVRDSRWYEKISDIENLCQKAIDATFQEVRINAREIEISVVLTGDDDVAVLNSQYRDKSGPTNVLSFPVFDTLDEIADVSSEMPAILGDVVIAFETVVREADASGVLIEDHLQHLVVHGVLHLLGYDHISEDQAMIMEFLESKILTLLDVPDPYGEECENV